jgi:hypothetical protein
VRKEIAFANLAYLKRGEEVLDDLSSDDVGSGEVGALFEAFVFEPEDVEVEFVCLFNAS